MKPNHRLWICAVGGLVWIASVARAADWPTYRADPARCGHSPDPLPAALDLRWMHQGRPPQPAWPSSTRVTYDFAHQPIIAGGAVIFGSTVEDTVVALDAATGKERWRFFTGGPVRFAPAAWRGRVFAASDDGFLYALAIEDGRLLWKHRGGPDARMCLGNGRMISRWPARGGPVVLDGTVYYAAGIWPSDGVYLHAIDAASGAVAWSNDRTGRLRTPQPHGGAEAASGVAPQGYLAATQERLFVPTGRAVPASFRRSDGELEHYLLQENGSMGGARAVIADRFVINGGCFLDVDTGHLAARAGRGVFGALPDGVLQFTGDTLLAYRWGEIEAPDKKGGVVRFHGLKRDIEVAIADAPESVRLAGNALAKFPALTNLFQAAILFKEADASVARQTGLERVLAQARPGIARLGAEVDTFLAGATERASEVIAAGPEAVCGTRRGVFVVDLAAGKPRWSRRVEGDAVGLATADGVLVVSTTSGAIYCFAAPTPDRPAAAAPRTIDNALPEPAAPPFDHAKTAAEILRKSGISSGICLDLGCDDGRLALELARQSQLQIIGVEADAGKVARARLGLAADGMYGNRVSIHQGDPAATGFPHYFADLIVSSRQLAGSPAAPDSAEIQRLQRPCGGVACVGLPGQLDIRRRGPLEGAGRWNHQNSDAANTLCSGDDLVRGPLEILWYRDGEMEIPDRHAQAPAPLFHQGYLVVEGVHGVCALDAYNGRTRWVHRIEGILEDWDGVHHDVGVGDTGGNFCLGNDAVFIRTGDRCLKLDLATGARAAEFRTPADAASGNRDWGYIACVDGILYGSVLNHEHTVSPRYPGIRLRTESVLLFAMDAASGRLLWQYRPEHSIRNNSIAIADGRVHLIDRALALADRITEPKPDGKHRPALKPGEHPGGKLVAIDARSGAPLWRNSEDVFGTQLAVSARHGVLLMYYQAVKHGFFKLPSEIGGRIAAFDARTGERLWDQSATYKTRPMINDGIIYAEGGAWNLRSGKTVPWKFERSYGCGQITAGRHMMLFRSATLGYLDLTRDAGTENFGGIRPSCWFNAIPAGGIVLVPDGSSKCACSYQAQAWLALKPHD